MPHTETDGRFEGGLVWMEFIGGVPNGVLGNLPACSAGTGGQEVSGAGVFIFHLIQVGEGANHLFPGKGRKTFEQVFHPFQTQFSTTIQTNNSELAFDKILELSSHPFHI